MGNAFMVGGLGEVLWDALPSGEAFGGAPANFTCHCRSLGAEAYIISAVGADERGSAAIEFLGNHGVSVSGLAICSDRETGVVQVTLDAKGKPTYDICEGVAWDSIPLNAEMRIIAGKLDAVCFGSLCQRDPESRRTIRQLLAVTRPEALRVFDINLRQNYHDAELIRDSIELANVLKLNDEELPVVAEVYGFHGDELEVLRSVVQSCDLKLAALTRGAEGSVLMTPGGVSAGPAHPAEIVSTVGAGDAFTATLVMDFLAERPLDSINAHANAVAAYVCSKEGAVPVLPPELCR
jgi:fructokinase